MRRTLYSSLAAVAAITTSYLAWCRTTEGRICGRFVRDEMTHYKTSHASTNPRSR